MVILLGHKTIQRPGILSSGSERLRPLGKPSLSLLEVCPWKESTFQNSPEKRRVRFRTT